jgi:hypothetical protein
MWINVANIAAGAIDDKLVNLDYFWWILLYFQVARHVTPSRISCA